MELTLRRQKASPTLAPAPSHPVARVLVDTGVGHLDEPYDYLVLASQHQDAQPGVRARVRFAGKLVDAWIIERRSSSTFAGKLKPLTSIVSPEILLTEKLLSLCQHVASRQAGSTLDVVRAAIPKRHAKVESEPSQPAEREWRDSGIPDRYPLLAKFFTHPRARGVWTLAPGGRHFEEIAQVVAHVAAQGKGVLVLVPDERDLAYLSHALGTAEGVVALNADLSLSERYRRYLRVSRGIDRVVIGTRAAAFAPVRDLGLMILLDDGDQSHFEQHAPTWSTLDVLSLRSHQEHVPLLLAGFSVSVATALLVEKGWAHLIPHHERPRVIAADEEFARVSTTTWKLIKESIAQGPVLISVARTGYRPVLQCRKCSSPALCLCGGKISQDQGKLPSCTLCGALHEKYQCRECGSTGFRTPAPGIERSAEELGRAFPSVPIKHSTGDRPLTRVPRQPSIVLSTQGVEPLTEGGYSAVVILDTAAALLRSDLRAEEEARRRWFNTAGLVMPGGVIAIAGDSQHPAIQSLIRWNPAAAATRELQQREQLHFSPAWNVAIVETEQFDPSLQDALLRLGEVLGPVEADSGWRFILRANGEIAAPLKKLANARGIRRQPIKIRLNPYTL